MKIAFIIRRLNVKGGAQRQILELAQELQKRGHDVVLYTFAYSRENCFVELLEGLRVTVWRGAEQKNGDAAASYAPFFSSGFFQENHRAKELALQIDRDTDLLHPHDQVAYRVAAYYKKYVKDIPSVWMMNDVPTRKYAAWYARRVRPDAADESLVKRLLHWFMDVYDMRLIRRQDAIAVLDNFNRENVRRFLGRDATVVRSGLDIAAFGYKEKIPPGRGAVRLLTTGIFMRHRRFEDAIEAVSILADRGIGASLTIIGDENNDRKYANEMHRLVTGRGVADRVSFSGRVSEEDLVRSYQEHHVFIFANDPQTWGLAVFEAMACGTPVIVSRGAGAHEVLTHGKNALLVSPRKPHEIAEAIENITANPALYSRLSHEGRVFVEQGMGWRKYADEMEILFKRVVSRNH